MKLRSLIDEGKRFKVSEENEYHDMKSDEEKKSKWIRKSINYLKENYPESVLTNDFIERSERSDKPYNQMVSILQGLKDVEEEIGMLKE